MLMLKNKKISTANAVAALKSRFNTYGRRGFNFKGMVKVSQKPNPHESLNINDIQNI
jgi:hypothetical protein